MAMPGLVLTNAAAVSCSLWLTIGIKDEMVKTLTTEYRIEKKASDSYKILKPVSDVVSIILVVFGDSLTPSPFHQFINYPVHQ